MTPGGPGASPDGGALPAMEVVVDDLAFWRGEAIARPVTAALDAPTPVQRRLEVAAGEALERQLRRPPSGEPLAVGAAVVTGAGALDVELLVHAVVSSREERATPDTVRRATQSALERAAEFGIEHLALPPFGLGAGNLDPESSAQAMLAAVRRHAARARLPRRLTFVVETEDERHAFTAALRREG